MDEKKKEEINQKLEEIFDKAFSASSAWEEVKKLASSEGAEDVYLTLLENIVDDLLQNEKEVKEYLKRIGWPLSEETQDEGEGKQS